MTITGEQASAGVSIAASRTATKPRVPGTLLALIILSQLPTAILLTVTAPLLASMAADLVQPGSGNFMIRLVTGIVGPALILGAPLAGWLADRMDRRPLLAALASIFIVAASAPFYLSGIEAIVASRFVAGATGGGMATIGMAMVGQYFDDERRPGVIGTIAFITLAGSILTLPVAGMLAEHGWRDAFLLFLALIPIVVLALLRPLPAPAQERTMGTAGGASAHHAGFPRLPISIVLIAFVMGLALNLAGILYSFYFTELGVKDVSTIAMLLMYQAIVAGAATLLFGKASKRFSQTGIFMICFASTALGLGIQGLTGDWRIAGASLTLTGISMGWLVANISSTTITLMDERHHGAALGTVHAIGALATLLGIAEPFIAALGIKGIFISVAMLSALILLALATGILSLRAGRAARR